MQRIFADPGYRERVAKVQAELSSYDSLAIIEGHVVEGVARHHGSRSAAAVTG